MCAALADGTTNGAPHVAPTCHFGLILYYITGLGRTQQNHLSIGFRDLIQTKFNSESANQKLVTLVLGAARGGCLYVARAEGQCWLRSQEQ